MDTAIVTGGRARWRCRALEEEEEEVSTVRGRLRPGVGWPELLGATFPPGR